MFGRPQNYMRLRVCGCQCFPRLRPYNKHKLEDKSKSCVFLGYSLTQSAYLCLDVMTQRIFTSRHVQFVEDVFPFQVSANNQSPSPKTEQINTMPTVTPVSLIAAPPVTMSSPLSSGPHLQVTPVQPPSSMGLNSPNRLNTRPIPIGPLPL